MPMFRDGYRPADDPRQPTNVPDDLHDRAHDTFAYTKKRSGSGHTTYLKPQTAEGYPDYALMLDLMGFEPGVVYDFQDRREIVVERSDTTAQWGETHVVPRGAYTTAHHDDQRDMLVEYTPGDTGPSVLAMWEYFIHGQIDVLGNVFEVDNL